jgi:hypothetical protein
VNVGVGHLEITQGTSTLGVHHPLGDALTVEVGEGIDEVKILGEGREREGGRISGGSKRNGLPSNITCIDIWNRKDAHSLPLSTF